MDSIDSTDWLKQIDHHLWAARIRQLREELRQSRENAHQTQSLPQQVEPINLPELPRRPSQSVLKK